MTSFTWVCNNTYVCFSFSGGLTLYRCVHLIPCMYAKTIWQWFVVNSFVEICVGNTLFYNQPSSDGFPRISCSPCHHAYQFEVWTARWWMGLYGGKTPKRHIAWSNSETVGLLDLGRLHGWDYKNPKYQANRTTKTTTKNGKKAFQGRKKELKDSQ